MLGIYLFAAVLGGGLLVFSILAGGDQDAADADVSGVDVHGDVDINHDFDIDHDIDVDHDVGIHGATPGQLALGLFRPRNIIFFLTGFGLTGALLTWLGNSANLTIALAVGMGAGSMVLTHGVFSWLRRSDSAVQALGRAEIEGHTARVVLPLTPGEPGRVACVIGDREVYLNAHLAEDAGASLSVGDEVVIVALDKGVAEVIPFDTRQLPP